MASTASPSLRLELMGTGDQSGTWGDTTNTNLGTLLEQAITGYLSIAKTDATAYTLTNTDYAVNQTRNMVIEFTGTPGGAFDVITPAAEKVWLFKNSTNVTMTVKVSGQTGVAVAAGSSKWLYSNGTDVKEGLSGTLAIQAAGSVAITGGTITGLTNLTLASGAATPATNDAATLGTSSLMWGDLFLASGGVVNFNNGDVTITHSTNGLAFAGADNGYTFSNTVKPSANDGAALGVSGTAFSDLFLASGGVVNFDAGDVTITHSANTLAFAGATSYTFDAPIGLASGGTGASLTDPNADRIMFWDDSAGAVTWLTAGSGLTITDTTLSVSASSPFTAAANVNTASNTQTFNASGTWTKPNTGNIAVVYVWGGGGFVANASSAGGGGGGFTMAAVELSDLAATETVTVGAGGIAAAANGGNSSFGTFAAAYGGTTRLNATTGTSGNASVTISAGGAGGGSSGVARVGFSGSVVAQSPTEDRPIPTVSPAPGQTDAPASMPVFSYTTDQQLTLGFVPVYKKLEGPGAAMPFQGWVDTAEFCTPGFNAVVGGGSGAFGTGGNANQRSGGSSIWGGGGGGTNGTAANSSGKSVYGGAGGWGNTATNGAGIQPGGGGGAYANANGNGGAGKVIVYVY